MQNDASIVQKISFPSCGLKQYVYVKHAWVNMVYVCLYVDDMVIESKRNDEIGSNRVDLRNYV